MKPDSQQPALSFADQRGMSLIEIMITMAIIGAMMALAGSYLFPGTEAKMREEATRLAGVVKFLYNEAAIKNRYYRLVFDIDGGGYSVESSSEPFRLTMVTDAKEKKPSPLAAKADAPDTSPAPGFTQESDQYLVAPRKLPSGVKFKDVFVLHEKERQSQGKVFAYFFPNGWAEKMIINLTDEDEASFYSIEVNPLTGKSKIRSEYHEVKEDELRAGSVPTP